VLLEYATVPSDMHVHGPRNNAINHMHINTLRTLLLFSTQESSLKENIWARENSAHDSYSIKSPGWCDGNTTSVIQYNGDMFYSCARGSFLHP
jgi:hypothetical protein